MLINHRLPSHGHYIHRQPKLQDCYFIGSVYIFSLQHVLKWHSSCLSHRTSHPWLALFVALVDSFGGHILEHFPTHLEIGETAIPSLSEIVRVVTASSDLLRVSIETRSIACESNFWDNRSFLSSIIDIIPIDAVKIWMRLNTRRTTRHIAESFRAINCT